MTAHGDVLVASPGKGRVYWLSHDAERRRRIGRPARAARRARRSERSRPSGMVICTSPSKARSAACSSTTPPATIDGKYEIVIDGLPTGGNHWKKTIRFGPDGLLYLNIGSSCNVCLEEDDRRAAMLRYTPDGKFVDIYATGLRNSAGFDWRADGTLYATDNGRDLLGDDFPPCELDQIRQGGFYGWPFANGDRVPDPGPRRWTRSGDRRVDSAGILVPRPQCAVGDRVPAQRQAASQSSAATHWSRCTDRGIAARRTDTRWSRCIGTPTARSARATF